MDPLSIIGLVGSVTTMVVRTSKSLNDIKTKYASSNATISSMISECSVISSALTHIEAIAKKDPKGLASRLDPSTSPLGSSFESALNGCSITLLVLNDEIHKTTGPEKVGFLGWKSKAKFIWNEEGMKDLLTTLRGQQSALHLLVSAIQTESMSDVKRMLNDNNALLQQMIQRSQTLRQKRAASTIGGHDQEFDFDDQIVSSTAYRRAFRSFVKRPESTSKGKRMEYPSTAYELPGSSTTFVEDSQSFTKSESLVQKFETAKLDVIATPQQRVTRKPIGKVSTAVSLQYLTPTTTSPSILTPTSGDLTSSVSNIRELSRREEKAVPVPALPRNPASDSLLRTAAEKGHASLIKILVQKGADINRSNSTGETPLILAVRHFHLETVKAILEEGANVGAKNSDGNSALNLACICNGQVPIVEALLDAGADIETEGWSKWHPLHHAAANDMILIIDLLLQRGAQLQSLSENGSTPLHSAIEYGMKGAVLKLLQQGADIHAKDTGGNLPLNIAAMKNRTQIAKILLEKGADIEGAGITGWHPLHHAACNSSVETLDFLIEMGADKESLADLGVRPIHVAAGRSLEWDPKALSLRALLKHGVNLEARQEVGDDNQAIHVAMKSGHLVAAQILIAAGLGIHNRGWHGFSPLHEAVAWGRINTAEWILQQGADPNFEADHNYRPIHAATQFGTLEATQLLLKQGVDVNVHCEDRSTPLACAATRGNVDVMKALVEYGANLELAGKSGERVIHTATCAGHHATVKYLTGLGVDLTHRNDGGSTPLAEAIRHKYPEIVKTLIKAGADIEGTGWEGWHPLHYAVCAGDGNMVWLLIELGANKEALASNGDRPLHVAAAYGKANTVKLLMDNGVDVSVSQNDGKTALDYAVEKGHADVVELLL